MGWVVIGGERRKVGHVGLGRGGDVIVFYKAHVTCQIEYLWEESGTSRVLKKK